VRTFVAVEVPPEPGSPSRDRAPEHLTLAFLGEIADERARALSLALEPVGGSIAPFDLTLEGVGAFPSRDRPRVVWVGASRGAVEIAELARRIRELVSKEVPLDARETFVPHLTLFRVRTAADRRRADELLNGAIPPPLSRTFRVGEFVLKESVLSSRGATHRTVARFPLRGAGPSHSREPVSP